MQTRYQQLKREELRLFKRIMRVMPSSPLQRELQAKRDEVRRQLAELKDNKCRWFLACTNEAVTNVPHPALGTVPTCERCCILAGYKPAIK
jgi:hypothetical protein